MIRKQPLTTRKGSSFLFRSIVVSLGVGALAWQLGPAIQERFGGLVESPESRFVRARLSREMVAEEAALDESGHSCGFGDPLSFVRAANYTPVNQEEDGFLDVRFRFDERALMSSLSSIDQRPSIQYSVKKGDTFSKIWTTHGSSTLAGMMADKACRESNVKHCGLRCGETLNLSFALDGSIAEVSKILPEGDKLVIFGSEHDGYEVEIEKAEVVLQERTVNATISSSIAEAAVQVDLPYAIVDELVDLFSARLDFSKDLQPGDAFTVIYNERHLNGDTVQPGIVKAASISNNGKMLVAVRHVGKDGKARYFDENGRVLGDYFLRYPVNFTRISSVFAKNRFHPALGVNRPHRGVDFAAPTGTPVRSVADGIVVKAGWGGGAGNMVKIKHDGRYTTEYFHLSKISSGIKTGTRVARGEVIGKVGSTGLATGPHLHFGFFDQGRYVDPLKIELPIAAAKGDEIPKGILVATIQKLEQQLETIKLAAAKDEEKSNA